MADATAKFKVVDVIPALGGKMIVLTTADDETVDNADTFTVTLSTYGLKNALAVWGFIHTTLNSVIAAEAPTTSVTSGVLTVTIGGSTANKKRVIVIVGESDVPRVAVA